MQQLLALLSLVVVALAQYPVAPRYGIYNNNYYGSYGSDPRMYYQQQYAQQQRTMYYNNYNRYYPYNYQYSNYGGYGGYGGYSNSYAQPQMGFMGMHNDGNGNLRIGNDLAALYITCNGRGCPVRG